MGEEEAELLEGEGEGEPVDPRMAAVLEAAESGDLETLCSLFDQVEVNARGEDGDSPLHIACLYGQAAVVEECIKRGADVNARDEDDSTPLHDAAAGGFEAIVAQLLLKGASTSAKDNEEDTPLHHAARGGHAAVVEKLLAACSDRTAAQHGQMCCPLAAHELSSFASSGRAWWLQALLQMANAAGERAVDLAENDAVRALLS